MDHLIKSVISSLIMFYIISQFELENLVEGVSVVLLGAVIYFAVLFLVRGLTRDDFKYMKIILKGN